MSIMLITKTMITTMMANDIAQAMFVQLLLNIVTNQYNTDAIQYKHVAIQMQYNANQYCDKSGPGQLFSHSSFTVIVIIIVVTIYESLHKNQKHFFTIIVTIISPPSKYV